MIEIDSEAAALAERAQSPTASSKLSLSAQSWAIFEGGRDPYVIMVIALAFMPYFVTTVVGDPVRGQALTAGYAKYAGIVVALTAPFLGAIVDKIGPRKPWLAASAIATAVLSACLWIAKPASSEAVITTVLWLTAILGVLVAYTDVFHNSMMPYAARPAEQAKASGLALALGNFVGVAMIIFMLWGFGLPGVVHSPLIPAKPLFGFSRATGDNIRMIGPLVGIVMALGLIPLLLYSHDAKPTGKSIVEGAREGSAELWSMIRHMRIPRDAGLFLIGRMLFADARLAALMFGGIYAAGVMKWGAPELLLMGFLAASCGVLGGFLAGWMDTWLGPKIALLIEIAVMTACLFAQLTISPTMIFFAPYVVAAHAPLWAAPIFNTPPQLAFLLITMISSVVGTSVFSSSRTMLTAVAPKENIGAFFGLYALSGAATAWLAPTLVEMATKVFHTQQAGMLPIALLFIAGMAALYFVRVSRPALGR